MKGLTWSKWLTWRTTYALPEKNFPCEDWGTETKWRFSTHQISKPLNIITLRIWQYLYNSRISVFQEYWKVDFNYQRRKAFKSAVELNYREGYSLDPAPWSSKSIILLDPIFHSSESIKHDLHHIRYLWIEEGKKKWKNLIHIISLFFCINPCYKRNNWNSSDLIRIFGM